VSQASITTLEALLNHRLWTAEAHNFREKSNGFANKTGSEPSLHAALWPWAWSVVNDAAATAPAARRGASTHFERRVVSHGWRAAGG